MKYALNIFEDNRILSACVVLPNGNYDGMPIVDYLPEGNLPDYLYINNQYIYDPIPTPEEPIEPQLTPEERIAALEEKLAAYEAKFAAMESETV